MFVGVTPDFFEGAPIEHPSASWSLCEPCINQSMEDLSYLRGMPGSWDRLEPVECIKAYSDFFQNRRRHVFLVSSNRNTTNSLWYETRTMRKSMTEASSGCVLRTKQAAHH
jgi:hypothetical protein